MRERGKERQERKGEKNTQVGKKITPFVQEIVIISWLTNTKLKQDN